MLLKAGVYNPWINAQHCMFYVRANETRTSLGSPELRGSSSTCCVLVRRMNSVLWSCAAFSDQVVFVFQVNVATQCDPEEIIILSDSD